MYFCKSFSSQKGHSFVKQSFINQSKTKQTMKSIFKFLGLAFVACSLLVACNPDEIDDNNNNNNETSFKITVNCNDATMGTVSITPKKDAYENGDEVTISATPNSGYKFLNWNGDITENPYTFTVNGNATYTANFQALPQASHSLTFNGSALDVAGYSDGQYMVQDGITYLLFQCAKNSEGNTVYFPYFVLWAQGMGTDVEIAENTELYKDNYYTLGQNNYGDWQYFSTNNFNCSNLDLTTGNVSMTGSMEMYSFSELYEGTHGDPADCTKATVVFTLNNITFVEASAKGTFGKKMIVK